MRPSKLKTPTVYFCPHDLNQNVPKFSASELKDGKLLIIVGPEGGLSKREEEILFSSPYVGNVHLRTNILRSTTAVCAAMGYCLSNYLS